MNNLNNENGAFSLKIFVDILLVFTVMLSVKWLADQLALNGAGGIGIWCGIGTATILMKRSKITWKSVGLVLPTNQREWLFGIGWGVLSVFIVFLVMGLLLDPILTSFDLVKPEDAGSRFQFFLGKPYVFIAYLVTVVWLGAALGEEILMRGFLLNQLESLFGKGKLSWILAILIHSIIFGLLHFYQGVYGVISTGFVSLVFGSVYIINKRRLFPVIMAHLLINTITLTAFYLSGGEVT